MKIRRTAIVLLTTAAIAAGGSPASAAPFSQVTGSGTIEAGDDLGTTRISVSGRVEPGESRVTGTGNVQINTENGGSSHGTINCLLIREEQAFASGTLDRPIEGNKYFLVSIEDRDQTGETDLAGLALSDEPFACARGTQETDVENGNFTVRERQREG